jgi:hypothetical protein
VARKGRQFITTAKFIFGNRLVHEQFVNSRQLVYSATYIHHKKKTSMSDYLQRSKDIWCNGKFVYGNWNIKPRAISFWNVDTIHYNLYRFILTNMIILLKGSSWPRWHGNQCQSPSGNSRLTRYGAWRGIPNTPVCVLYLVRLLVILCQ